MIVAILPVASLESNRRKRIVASEQQTDAFILALKSTPSIGDAFSSLVPVVQEPLKSEIVAELERRYQHYLAHPETAVPWEEVSRRMKERRQERKS